MNHPPVFHETPCIGLTADSIYVFSLDCHGVSITDRVGDCEPDLRPVIAALCEVVWRKEAERLSEIRTMTVGETEANYNERVDCWNNVRAWQQWGLQK